MKMSMSLKPTHQSILKGHNDDVTAWQFSHFTSFPLWVAQAFHLMGGDRWEGIATDGEIIPARVGDWAVAVEDSVIVLTDEEFKKCFRPL